MRPSPWTLAPCVPLHSSLHSLAHSIHGLAHSFHSLPYGMVEIDVFTLDMLYTGINLFVSVTGNTPIIFNQPTWKWGDKVNRRWPMWRQPNEAKRCHVDEQTERFWQKKGANDWVALWKRENLWQETCPLFVCSFLWPFHLCAHNIVQTTQKLDEILIE